jgi:hypothetical protein
MTLAQARSALAQVRRPGPGSQVRLGHRDLEIQLDDEVKVRSLKPPVQYDEKGKPRRLTDEERKELKGKDPKVPGYARNVTDLKPGQVVQVYLSRERLAKRDVNAAKDDAKKGEPNEKSAWVPAGKVTGTVASLGNQKGGGPEGAGDAMKKIKLRVDYATPGRSGGDNGGNANMGKNVYATMIVILQDVRPAPAKPQPKVQDDK